MALARGVKSTHTHAPAPGQAPPRLDGKRDIHPAGAGLEKVGGAQRPAAVELGGDRPCGALRRRDTRVFRLPDLSDLRLLLRALVGPGPAARAPAGLPRLPRTHRASPGDRLRDDLLDLRRPRRPPDGARLDRLLRRGRHGPLPARAALLRPRCRGARGAFAAEPLL